MPTLWDVVLVNALTAILADPIGHAREQEQCLEMIRAALPQVTGNDPRMVREALVGQRLIDAWPQRGKAEWARAKLDAGMAHAEFMRGRAVELLRQVNDKGKAA